MKHRRSDDDDDEARPTKRRYCTRSTSTVADFAHLQELPKTVRKQRTAVNRLTFGAWQRESLRGHLLTRGLVVLDVSLSWPVFRVFTVHVLARWMDRGRRSSQVTRPFKRTPRVFVFHLTDQQWCNDLAVKEDILTSAALQDKLCNLYLSGESNVPPLEPWQWLKAPLCVSLYRDAGRELKKQLHAADFCGVPYASYTSPEFRINWPLTTEYHRDRDNYPFMRDHIQKILPEPLVELVVAFFDAVLPQTRAFSRLL